MISFTDCFSVSLDGVQQQHSVRRGNYLSNPNRLSKHPAIVSVFSRLAVGHGYARCLDSPRGGDGA